MNIFLHYIIKPLSIIGLFLFLASCQIATINLNTDLKDYNVNLYLKEYTPKFKGPIPQYKGKKMCLANIRNDARNTTNFSYYSKDEKVQYLLSNQANTHIQLIPIFFWYAYQKAFEHAGIETHPRCGTDMPELWIIFKEFDDDDLRFRIALYENRDAIVEKELTISMPPVQNRSTEALQKRAYEMIDLTIKTILKDPGFQAGFI